MNVFILVYILIVPLFSKEFNFGKGQVLIFLGLERQPVKTIFFYFKDIHRGVVMGTKIGTKNFFKISYSIYLDFT